MRLVDLAWRDFVLAMARLPGVVAEFNALTGRSFREASATPLDRMIDEATGKVEDDAQAFVLWVTQTYWGTRYAPLAVRQALKSRRQRLPSSRPGVRRGSDRLRSPIAQEEEGPAMPSQQQVMSALNTTIAPWLYGLPNVPTTIKAALGEVSYFCQTYSSAARTPAAGAAQTPNASRPRNRTQTTAKPATARKAATPTTTASRRRTAAGGVSTSAAQIMDKVPVGPPGVTQAQIRTRMPKGTRANSIGRTLANQVRKGAVIKDGEVPTAKYYQPAEAQRAAA